MTSDDIIRMAQEAGATVLDVPRVGKIIGYNDARITNFAERFAALVAAAEREACAKLCEELRADDLQDDSWNAGASDCAAAISARH